VVIPAPLHLPVPSLEPIGILGLVLTFALARLLRPALPEPAPPGIADAATARALVGRSPRTYAHLAWRGDNAFPCSANATACIMYAVGGRSWVALGDPVGPAGAGPARLWHYRELGDRHGGWTVFDEVRADHLHGDVDLGFTLLTLGEEARVPLAAFSLEGGARRGLRRCHARLARAGCAVAVLPRAAVAPLLPELQAIADAWLAQKHTREQGCSVGCCDDAYLHRCPVGIVRWQGKLTAVVNILLGADQEARSPDLLRHRPEAPDGVMAYRCTQLLRWGTGEGHRWCSRGMAPLAGREARPLAPRRNHLAALVVRHGEHGDNCRGVRPFTAPCDPAGEPKDLASSRALALPRILANIAALTSSGLTGAVAK
jgi:phosphatidylglycerol lysyltransferase